MIKENERKNGQNTSGIGMWPPISTCTNKTYIHLINTMDH